MDLSVFENQISKTGFVLEHEVSLLLRKAGWSVISNKYYIDDTEDTVREIDLVAYKVSPIQQFMVYTVLIISCKKSEANTWAFLARDLDRRDPNRVWSPLHVWSNDKALVHEIATPAFASDYHDAALKRGGLAALAHPAMDVFAFQEMNCQSGAPQNDKAIFSSITSLMKAQSYELSAAPRRKKDVCLYQFNLATVVDADLVRIVLGASPPQAEEIKSETYIASYIIKKKEEFSRIRFISASVFEKTVQEYGQLHRFNCEVFSDVCDRFYKDIVTDWKRVDVLIVEFRKLVSFELYWRNYERFKASSNPFGNISLKWKADPRKLSIQVSLKKEHLNFLNEEKDANSVVAEALKNVYRYAGPFVFEEFEDIPF